VGGGGGRAKVIGVARDRARLEAVRAPLATASHRGRGRGGPRRRRKLIDAYQPRTAGAQRRGRARCRGLFRRHTGQTFSRNGRSKYSRLFQMDARSDDEPPRAGTAVIGPSPAAPPSRFTESAADMRSEGRHPIVTGPLPRRSPRKARASDSRRAPGTRRHTWRGRGRRLRGKARVWDVATAHERPAGLATEQVGKAVVGPRIDPGFVRRLPAQGGGLTAAQVTNLEGFFPCRRVFSLQREPELVSKSCTGHAVRFPCWRGRPGEPVPPAAQSYASHRWGGALPRAGRGSARLWGSARRCPALE